VPAGPLYDEVRDAITAIDRVHGVSQLPRIPVRLTVGISKRGAFRFHPATGEPIAILLRSDRPHRRLTFLHEIGHFIDWMILGEGRRFGSLGRPLQVGNWERAVGDSTAYLTLRAMLGEVTAHVLDSEGRPALVRLAADRVASIRQWLLPEELWARSYAQYVALLAGDPDILASLDSFRVRRSGEVYYPMQWTDEDFVPIARAIDDCFRDLGWRA
jgi:hypothetical protein